MKIFAHRICIGCIGGLYFGLIMMSISIYFFSTSSISIKHLLATYGIAMLSGLIIGGLVSSLYCLQLKSCKKKWGQFRITDEISIIELILIGMLTLLCILLIIYAIV